MVHARFHRRFHHRHVRAVHRCHRTNLVDFAYIVLGMAMAALGINVNFSAIAKKGQKAFLASFITSVLLMVLCGRSLSAVLLIGLASPIA